MKYVSNKCYPITFKVSCSYDEIRPRLNIYTEDILGLKLETIQDLMPYLLHNGDSKRFSSGREDLLIFRNIINRFRNYSGFSLTPLGDLPFGFKEITEIIEQKITRLIYSVENEYTEIVRAKAQPKRIRYTNKYLKLLGSNAGIVFIKLQGEDVPKFNEVISSDSTLVNYYISKALNYGGVNSSRHIDRLFDMLYPRYNDFGGRVSHLRHSDVGLCLEIDPFLIEGYLASELWQTRSLPNCDFYPKFFADCKGPASDFVNQLTNDYAAEFFCYKIHHGFNNWFYGENIYHGACYCIFIRETGSIYILSIINGV